MLLNSHCWTQWPTQSNGFVNDIWFDHGPANTWGRTKFSWFPGFLLLACHFLLLGCLDCQVLSTRIGIAWNSYEPAKWWCCWSSRCLHNNIWGFPKIGLPPVIIHFERWDFLLFFTKQLLAIGDPPWLWKPPYIIRLLHLCSILKSGVPMIPEDSSTWLRPEICLRRSRRSLDD